MYTWGIFLAYIRRRLLSRLRFHFIWEAGRDTYPRTPFGIRITTHYGVLTPLDPHVEIPEFGACEFSRLLIRVAQWKHSGSAEDQS